MSIKPKIPETWCSVNLGDVVHYGSPKKIESIDITSNTWILELEDIEKESGRIIKKFSYSDRPTRSTKNKFSAGDVLYGKLRPYLKKVVYADEAGACSTEIVPLEPNCAVDGRYLYHWLRHPMFHEYVVRNSHGINMPRLGTEAGRNAPFILAPIVEQRRIADKLDALLAQVDAVNERLANAATLLKRFRQSLIAFAMEGKLLNSKSSTNNDYPKAPLSSLSNMRLGKMLDKAKNSGKTTPYLRNQNIRWFSFDLRDVKTLQISPKEAEELRIKNGDLLVCEGGEPGRCAIWAYGDNDLVFQKAIHRIRTNTKELLPEWLALHIRHQCDTGEIEELLTGSTIKHLTGQNLAKLLIPLPPIEEQAEIVRRVETLFAFADKLEARIASAQAMADRLTPALLAKAFRGELVPQDPNDEPASELLRRLQEERAQEQKMQKSTKAGRRAKMN